VTANGRTPVAPSRLDPLVREGSELIGGPIGARSAGTTGWWSPVRILLTVGTIGFLIGYLRQIPCFVNSWGEGRYLHMCYTDIAPLYSLRGFADGRFPYLDPVAVGQEVLEYPVLTGLFMQVASWITPGDSELATLWFFNVNALMLFVCLLVLIAATALTVRRRPWDAAMVALAPGLILCATINWDLLAVALLAVGLFAWSRTHPIVAGLFIGLAAAAKFYPLLLLLPLAVLCLRAARLGAFAKCLFGTALAWLAVNVPFILLNFDGWFHFYAFSSTRGEDFGSVWLLLTNLGHQVPPGILNRTATSAFVVLTIGVVILLLAARRRPRLAAGCFLIVAAFVLTNKVYSPQFVIWLIPLAALARPRWRDFLIWQACEVVYFAGIWLYLAELGGEKGLPPGWYAAAIAIHLVGTGWFAAMVIRDVVSPRHDPVRTDGTIEDSDDPGGGPLDGRPDAFTLGRRGSRPTGPITGGPPSGA